MEDAKAALDLYKLVENEWESDLAQAPVSAKELDNKPSTEPADFPNLDYFQDEYWPEEL